MFQPHEMLITGNITLAISWQRWQLF